MFYVCDGLAPHCSSAEAKYAWPILSRSRKHVGQLRAKSTLIGQCVKLYRGMCCNRWSSEERLEGKTVIITGANTGIGKETARDLARRGARIVMACRDLERAEEAKQDIFEDTGNENLVIRKLDLSDTKSIRAFAELINKVNILINNAGIMMCPYSKTADGFEMQLGVNHLGHFLLTYLLLDLIKRSAPSRIVVVASVAHTWTGLRLDDINSERSYDTMKAYGQSKLANVVFARSLAKRLHGTGVSVFSLHPGVVQSDLWRHQHQFNSKTSQRSVSVFSDCAAARSSRASSDDESAQKLWEISCNLLGITWE
uniref:Zgc:112332 n=1 Tax=Neogobius melanostomus TaxID=47308 RepID=A0A8C6WJ17_9GOBI